MGFDNKSTFTGTNPPNNVTDFAKNVSKGLQKYKSSAVQAIDPIKNKLKDGVALVKSTESKISNTITSYKSDVIQNLNSIIGSLTGGLVNVDDITKYVKVGPNGVSFDKQGLAANLGSKIGIDLTTNNSLMYQLTNSINQQFNDLTGGYFGNMVQSDGSSFRVTQNWRDKLGNGLLDALQRTTGVQRGLFDYTITTAYNNSLLNLSAQYGMSDSYAGIMTAYTDQQDAKTALIDAVSFMLRNGDLISINEVLTLIDPYQYGVLNAKYPQLISQIFANYAVDPNTDPATYPTIKANLLNVCSKVVGPTWYLRTNEFGTTFDLSTLATISDDIKKVLLSDNTYPELIPLICATGMFTSMSAITVFTQQFPNVPMLDQSE